MIYSRIMPPLHLFQVLFNRATPTDYDNQRRILLQDVESKMMFYIWAEKVPGYGGVWNPLAIDIIELEPGRPSLFRRIKNRLHFRR